MKLKTRDFGEIELAEEELFTFTQPLFGFEDYKTFALLFDDELGDELVFLQSAQEPGLRFILSDPAAVKPSYHPPLPENAEALLGKGEYCWWLVTVVAPDFKESTVNLRSPILFNPVTRKAAQILLEDDLPVRSKMFEEEGQ
ncbi:MAG: flagellar assembly protein FliW [Oscillospiraceae bacterium]|nr:flagellar assembly protein FliW [Oscillospiraceae bacterium]